MFPGERQEVWQRLLVDGLTLVAQGLYRSLQVDCVPQDDDGDFPVEAARAIALVLEQALEGRLPSRFPG